MRLAVPSIHARGAHPAAAVHICFETIQLVVSTCRRQTNVTLANLAGAIVVVSTLPAVYAGLAPAAAVDVGLAEILDSIITMIRATLAIHAVVVIVAV
jgi:hypothetical protein